MNKFSFRTTYQLGLKFHKLAPLVNHNNLAKNLSKDTPLISQTSPLKEQQEYVVDAEKRALFDFRELWSYKELFYFFTWRDIKIKYKQTALGFLWAILQPLFMMIVFTLFFGRALNVPSQGLPYPIFVFSGLLLWNTFSSGLTNSANSMVNNSQIIK